MSDEGGIFDIENISNISQTLVQCAICQDVIAKNNISYVDLCLHQYCFDCLKQWCEVKAECPLCKHKIEKIIHSVKSPQTYKEFVPGPTLHTHVEDSFDFNQTFDSVNDIFQIPINTFSDNATIRSNEMNAQRLQARSPNLFRRLFYSSSSSEEELIILDENSDAEIVETSYESHIETEDDSNDQASEQSIETNNNSDNISIIESESSIIQISSESEEDGSDHQESDLEESAFEGSNHDQSDGSNQEESNHDQSEFEGSNQEESDYEGSDHDQSDFTESVFGESDYMSDISSSW